MAELERIQAIQTLVTECEAHRKAMVQLRVAGTSESLTLTCASLDAAESLADLIDGYCRLFANTTTSLWSRKGNAQLQLLSRKTLVKASQIVNGDNIKCVVLTEMTRMGQSFSEII